MRHRIVVAHVFAAIAALVAMHVWADPAISKSEADHRAKVCGLIQTIDLLMYDNPHGHAPTTTCSYTANWLLIKPKTELPPDRMKRFAFLAFVGTGALRNDGLRLPANVYVGFGADCQWMTVNNAAIFQKDAYLLGKSGMMRSIMLASERPHIACPPSAAVMLDN
jgi:hypothetical protein